MPILFRCNELPFRCFASSMFSCSMKCRSFVSHWVFNSLFTALAFSFNVELSPQDMIADTTTSFSPFLRVTAKSLMSFAIA